ncbi:autotransporter domain-containing protein [Sphingomonas sp. PL-96]|uniref:autotransporter domain-containing protein n=1 Tax=Sphingomonas sp. PL-96 TaxID=2887201 RepID=UPI001E4B7643|nr:autotransporter domain-containing protein [Sphingomonas sp. PL-96]MCC2976595.1 autotransporter domain-containing protein [Sphingomonas sp. PL-96]
MKPEYSPAADNGSGVNSEELGVIDIFQRTTTIEGDYVLQGTSARRFEYDTRSLAEREQQGEILSGYEALEGQSVLELTPERKTQAVTYPDMVQGTRQASLVYDNDLLTEVASGSAPTVTYVDTGGPVYGDLRLANISQSTVTIATGDKGRSIFDSANFALLTADSGSTLYNVTGNSVIVYDSITATMHGDDQDGLAQDATTTLSGRVTRYSGVEFGAGDRVTDLASLKRYNDSLIAELTSGQITPETYEQRIQAAVTTTNEPVVVRTPQIPTYSAPATTSDPLFIALHGSAMTTTEDSQLVGVFVADGNSDGGSTLILARNGSTVVNNGTIVQGGTGVGIRVTDEGSALTNAATGVIGVGYETLDRSSGRPLPTGYTDYDGATFNTVAIRATNGAVVNNLGIVNVSNRDITGHDEEPRLGKGNMGVVVSSGAQAINGGTILIGGGDSAVANTRDRFDGAVGMGVFDGGTATNAAAGVIRIGSSFAGNRSDLDSLVDVQSVNQASGMVSMGGGGTILNDGLISIGGLAQNARGMLVGGDGNRAVNSGTIVLGSSQLDGVSAQNVGISVLGSNEMDQVHAINAVDGAIIVNGTNSIGLLVRNGVDGGAARGINDGLIDVDGSLSGDRLRNYGIFVDNAGSSAVNNGEVVLRGQGAIGIHARNGATVIESDTGTLDFTNADQIGYYALGAGSTIVTAGVTDVDTRGSTGLRIEGGANATGSGLRMIVSGASAYGVVASGASERVTFDGAGAAIVVSGSGSAGIRIEGGATGVLDGSSAITLAGDTTTAAVIDGQAFGLDGTAAGAPVATTALVSSAALAADHDTLTGYVVRNGGQLQHSGTIAFSGTDNIGIRIAGTATAATHMGSVALAGSGIGVAVSGGRLSNQGSITVADGTGILLDGVGSTLVGSSMSAVIVNDGVAALRVTNGAAVETSGSFTAGGTAHAVLVDIGSGSVLLADGTLTTSGSGNGLENAANSGAIRLNGTAIAVTGSGSGIRTAVTLDPASTATITAAGTDSTGFTFAAADGAATTGDLTLGAGFAITASGTGATGVRLATGGNATLTGTVSVTSAAGGSALVAGPAASVTNTGTFRSIASAPVIDLTGGTQSFTTSGTIAAASPGAIAITGGDNGQAVTVSGGEISGAVVLGRGADTVLMTAGTLTGSLATGEGDDSVTFRGITEANLSGTTSIAGGGVGGGNDVLTFEQSTTAGTRRLTGWNAIHLVASTLTSDGDVMLAGGTLTIDAASTFLAGGGTNTVIAGNGSKATVVNAGRIDLTNGASGATDRLVIRGDYVGQSGTLALDTVLGPDGSPSDRLVIDGGAASGRTVIAITNLDGLGAATTGDGIQIIEGINGGTTTATTTKDAFVLAGGEINVGAFEYRLYASDIAGTGEGWYLRTQATSVDDPTYRVEAPLLAALSGWLRQGDLDMLSTYHRRMGDRVGSREGASGFTVPGRLWGRLLLDDHHYRQSGTVSPVVDGRTHGFQLGIDLFQFGDARGRHDIGVYGGYADGKARVRGSASGTRDLYVGDLHPDTVYAGAYWTYSTARFYVDTVVQHSWYGGHAGSVNNTHVGIDGTGALASAEIGYSMPFLSSWSIEPQVQLIAQGVSLDRVAIPAADVVYDNDTYLTGRLGLRVRGDYVVGRGSVQPYLRANLWKGFASSDRTIFVTSAAITAVETRTSSFWGEAGGGLTWAATPQLALFGEGTHRFALDGGQGVVGHSTGGSVGAKLNF